MTGYLKIDDIPGESRRADHEDEIDVHDIIWGIEQAAQVGRGGRARARAEVDDLVCMKEYDAASPYLALAAAQGKVFDEAVVTVRRDSGDAHLDYLTITLTDVLVSEYELLGTDPDRGDGVLVEAVALRAEKVTIRYVVQEDDQSRGDEHEVEIDVTGRRV